MPRKRISKKPRRSTQQSTSIEHNWPPAGAVQVGPYELDEGEYWVGDLCHVLCDEHWKEIKCLGYLTLSDGREVVQFKLPDRGGGTYPSNDGKRYLVDSGTIGITRVEGLLVHKLHHGHIIVYTNKFSCMCITAAHPQGGGDVSFNSFGQKIQIDSDDQCYSISGFIRNRVNTRRQKRA
jgi:hypothetical protein